MSQEAMPIDPQLSWRPSRFEKAHGHRHAEAAEKVRAAQM